MKNSILQLSLKNKKDLFFISFILFLLFTQFVGLRGDWTMYLLWFLSVFTLVTFLVLFRAFVDRIN